VYAIIEDSGTQIMVRQGDVVNIDLRPLADSDKTITFANVLAVGDEKAAAKVGKPFLTAAKVTADILGEVSGDKLTTVKYSRRKGYRKKTGHKQGFLKVRITSIEG
jgi:large subunit ribosomal protein L21